MHCFLYSSEFVAEDKIKSSLPRTEFKRLGEHQMIGHFREEARTPGILLIAVMVFELEISLTGRV